MPLFTREYTVRFEDCDLAGIVFFPRYVLMLHRFFEDWLADGVGVSLRTMHEIEKIGFPVVKLDIQFKKPSRLEETLEWLLEVQRLGNSSVHLNIQVRCGSEERLTFQYIVACTALGGTTIQPQSIPMELRRKIEFFVEN